MTIYTNITLIKNYFICIACYTAMRYKLKFILKEKKIEKKNIYIIKLLITSRNTIVVTLSINTR